MALREVHGIVDPSLPPIAAAGRTDQEIARAICLASGIAGDVVDACAVQVLELAADRYELLVPPSLEQHVAPGVHATLRALDARRDVVHGLLTGNIERIARLKLARAGLARWFADAPGAFGSDSEDRMALPPIARARAGAPGAPWPRERTVIVGDTPRDIACARADGLRVIAVATGPHLASDLTDADVVLDALAGVPDVL